MIMVNTNLLINLLLPTSYTAQAEAKWAWIETEWHPVLFIPSYVMFFWEQSGVKILRWMMRIFCCIVRLNWLPYPKKPWTAVRYLPRLCQSGCRTYDCKFVWLARDLGLPLVTVDKQVLNAFSDLAVLPEIFCREYPSWRPHCRVMPANS